MAYKIDWVGFSKKIRICPCTRISLTHTPLLGGAGRCGKVGEYLLLLDSLLCLYYITLVFGAEKTQPRRSKKAGVGYRSQKKLGEELIGLAAESELWKPLP